MGFFSFDKSMMLELGIDPDAEYEWLPWRNDPFLSEPVFLVVNLGASYFGKMSAEKIEDAEPMIYTYLKDGGAFAKSTPEEFKRYCKKI